MKILAQTISIFISNNVFIQNISLNNVSHEFKQYVYSKY